MTDYPALRRTHTSWKKARVARKWREMLAVFVVLLLVFVIVGGLLKKFSFRSEPKQNAWDGSVSLAIAIKSSPPSILVYEHQRQKVGIFKFSEGLSYATGMAAEPVKTVASVYELPGEEASGVLTNLTGINVSKYVYMEQPPDLNGKGGVEMFKNFASFKTPLGLILGGSDLLANSNMTRGELLRLWWQLKGISVSAIDVVDAEDFADEILGPKEIKFKGFDRDSAWRELVKYFEGGAGVHAGDIEVINDSGVVEAGKLATTMLTAYGWNVNGISISDVGANNCRIAVFGKKPNADKLAKVFGCELALKEDVADNDKVIFYLGRDFASRYF